MDKVEPEGEEASDPEQEKPASPVITKRSKSARPVVVKKVRE